MTNPYLPELDNGTLKSSTNLLKGLGLIEERGKNVKSSRRSSGDGSLSPAMPANTNHNQNKGKDFPTDVGTAAAEKSEVSINAAAENFKAPTNSRISARKLEEILNRLGDRDKDIISSLSKYRFLTSKQLQRLFFYLGKTASANTRATNKALNKLKELSLVDSLAQRIGGVRAGSSALIWHLTEAGYRIQYLNQKRNTDDTTDAGDTDGTKGESSKDTRTLHKTALRKRINEPSPLFLRHTLAVAEVALQVRLICRSEKNMKLDWLDTEPEAWRYFYAGGREQILKPDLFAITELEKYEDRWFFEMDLGTESPSKVVEKCLLYLAYYQSGKEADYSEVFPLVTWIVPDQKRKVSLKRNISAALPKTPKMFIVITPEELPKLLKQGISPEELC